MTTPPENELLHKVAIELEALAKARAHYSPQLAPDFSVFDYIDTSELGLSRILGDLLNPKGRHAQGTLFLRRFIETCLPDIAHNAAWLDFMKDLPNTRIFLEERTSATNAWRRMDIYLSQAPQFGICIENKPYAHDQEAQISDYVKELKERHPHFHLVYLNERGIPSAYSISEEELKALKKSQRITFLTYTNLTKWLKACMADIQNASVLEFSKQLVQFIYKQFTGVNNMSEQQLLLQNMVKNEETITAAIKISANITEMMKLLMTKLVEDLEKHTKEEYTITADDFTGARWEGINFSIPGKEYSIRFEFGSTGFNNPVLGIFSPKDLKASDHKQIFDKIENLFKNQEKNSLHQNIRFKDNGHWPMWYWFSHLTGDNGSKPCTWQNDAKPWKMIKSGKMAEKIIAEVDALYKFLQNAESAPK